LLFCVLHLFFSIHFTRLLHHSFPTRRSSDLKETADPALPLPRNGHRHRGSRRFSKYPEIYPCLRLLSISSSICRIPFSSAGAIRSEEHTSELQSRFDIVCRLLLEKKNYNNLV